MRAPSVSAGSVGAKRMHGMDTCSTSQFSSAACLSGLGPCALELGVALSIHISGHPTCSSAGGAGIRARGGMSACIVCVRRCGKVHHTPRRLQMPVHARLTSMPCDIQMDMFCVLFKGRSFVPQMATPANTCTGARHMSALARGCQALICHGMLKILQSMPPNADSMLH